MSTLKHYNGSLLESLGTFASPILIWGQTENAPIIYRSDTFKTFIAQHIHSEEPTIK